MLLGVSIALAIVVVFVGYRLVQRRRRDEIRSIHHYHDRLDTLHVQPHDRGGSVHVVEGETRVADAHHEPDRPRLDPGAARLDPWVPEPTQQEAPHRHDRSWALGRMQPRTRIDTGTIVIISVVVIALVAIAVAGYLVQRGRDHGTSTTTTTTTTSPSTSGGTTTTARGADQVALETSVLGSKVSGLVAVSGALAPVHDRRSVTGAHGSARVTVRSSLVRTDASTTTVRQAPSTSRHRGPRTLRV